jgi:hypothetical protein
MSKRFSSKKPHPSDEPYNTTGENLPQVARAMKKRGANIVMKLLHQFSGNVEES